jgi:Protein of unknown function (DUF3618)
MEGTTGAPPQAGAAGGNGRFATPPPGTRTAAQIRDDIEAQRGELARSVDALRARWAEVTDVGTHLRNHRTQLLIGAAVAGFVIGGALALRRR